jgi:hypothetical protein
MVGAKRWRPTRQVGVPLMGSLTGASASELLSHAAAVLRVNLWRRPTRARATAEAWTAVQTGKLVKAAVWLLKASGPSRRTVVLDGRKRIRSPGARTRMTTSRTARLKPWRRARVDSFGCAVSAFAGGSTVPPMSSKRHKSSIQDSPGWSGGTSVHLNAARSMVIWCSKGSARATPCIRRKRAQPGSPYFSGAWIG